jgi:hypothetical protein
MHLLTLKQDPCDSPQNRESSLTRFDLTEGESRGLFTISHCPWLKITNSLAFGVIKRTQGLADLASKTGTLIFLEGFGRYRGFICERKPRLEHNTNQ